MVNNKDKGSIILGVVLVGLGAVFLLGRVFNLNLGQYLWPFFIIIPGLLFFVGMMLGGKEAGPLAIPGSIVTMVGLILLYQAVTGYFASWAYAWALIFPTSVGIGLAINGGWSNTDVLIERGIRWAGTGIMIFIGAGIFFELILNISGNPANRLIWPTALIAAGIYLMIRRSSENNQPTAPVQKEQVAEAKPSNEPEFEPLDMTRTKK